MKKIYLFRHPHIETQQKMVGRWDFPLSDVGFAQAHHWQEQLKNIKFQKIYSSELMRTIKAAQIISSGQDVLSLKAFNEISLGQWEGKDKAYIQKHYSKLWRERGENLENVAPPGGENFIQLQNRVLEQFLNIAENCQSHENILIIGHQAVNRVILAHLKQIPLNQIQTIAQDYACLNILSGGKTFEQIEYLECPVKNYV